MGGREASYAQEWRGRRRGDVGRLQRPNGRLAFCSRMNGLKTGVDFLREQLSRTECHNREPF